MEAITASLERSLQNCSLNNNNYTRRRGGEEEEGSGEAGDGLGISSKRSDDDVVDNHNHNHNHDDVSDTTLELNSHLSLPYHWEQCLDLKTGEIYYINWRNGIKAKEDPRSMRSMISNTNRNDDYEEESEEEEEESWYDSEESSSESCCPSSTSNNNNNKEYHQNNNINNNNNNNNNNVLVVAGCKSCLMYFMVPKQVEDCPKCTGQLLHFDRSSQNTTASTTSP